MNDNQAPLSARVRQFDGRSRSERFFAAFGKVALALLLLFAVWLFYFRPIAEGAKTGARTGIYLDSLIAAGLMPPLGKDGKAVLPGKTTAPSPEQGPSPSSEAPKK